MRQLLFVFLGLIHFSPQIKAEIVAEQIDGGWTFKAFTQRAQQSIPFDPAIESDYREHRWEQCRDKIDSLCRLHTNLPPAELVFAWLHLAHGNLGDAKPLLESLFIRDPAHPEIALTLGQVAVAENRFADALVHLERAAALALPTPWSKSEQQSFAVSILDARAAVFESQGRWPDALATLEKALAISSQNTGRVIRMARAHYELSDRQKAADILEEHAFWSKNLLPPESVLARFACQKNEFDEANRLYLAAVAKAPENPQTHIALARFELEQRHAEQALGTIGKARRQGLSDRGLDDLEGDALMSVGRYHEAAQVYERLLQDNENNESRLLRRSLALCCSGSSADQLAGQLLAEQVAVKSPQNAQAVAVLGFAHFQLGHFDLAKPLIGRAVELTPIVTSDLAYWLAELLMRDEATHEAGRTSLQASLSGSHGVFLMHHRALHLATLLENGSFEIVEAVKD